jgi:hypothetical protein
MKTLLSLFDYSGTWSDPFFQAGWNVIKWDIKLDELMDIHNIDSVEYCLENFENVDGIIAAVPCTDFASSGARWFNIKDQTGQTAASILLVSQVMKIVDVFEPTDPEYEGTFFWAIENPVGRIGSLTGLDNPYYFHPSEFAGWNSPSSEDLKKLSEIRTKNGKGVTPEESDFILQMEAYTKKTGLWGNFNRNMKKMPIEPVKGNEWGSPHMRLGGKSDRTKEIRSNTPKGFSRAFYEANKDYQSHKQTVQLPLF